MKVSMYVPALLSVADKTEKDPLLALGHHLASIGGEIGFYTFTKGTPDSSRGSLAGAFPSEGMALKLYEPKVLRVIGMPPQFFSRQLVKDLVAEASDIVHVHGISQVSLLFSILRNVQCPVVLSPLHCYNQPQTVASTPGSKLLRYSFSHLGKRIARFITESPEAKSRLVHLGAPENKIMLLHHTIDYFKMANTPRREEEMILCVGRYAPNKGLHILIDAAKMMLQIYPHLIFHLVGSPGDQDYHNLLKENVRGYETRIKVTGPLEEVSLLDLFSRARLLVFPSLEDTHGLIILEAMGGGIPVVATMVAATSVLIKDGVNGLLVPPNNVSLLADSRLSLWKDKEKRAMLAGNGRETAKRYYWEEYAVKLMRIYSEVLGCPVS